MEVCMANNPTNEQLVGDRSWLRRLHTQHPDWSHRHLALEIGRSLSWVKNWLKRFSRVSPTDEAVLWGLPRSTKTPPPPPHPLLLERLLHLRHNPPFNLKRIPGPRTLLAALKQDPELF